MDINTKEIIDNPDELLAQIFFLLNTWAEVDMARMNGDIDHEGEVIAFTVMIRPLAKAWVEGLEALSEDRTVSIMDAHDRIRAALASEIL
jgi:hypothetical protein